MGWEETVGRRNGTGENERGKTLSGKKEGRKRVVGKREGEGGRRKERGEERGEREQGEGKWEKGRRWRRKMGMRKGERRKWKTEPRPFFLRSFSVSCRCKLNFNQVWLSYWRKSKNYFYHCSNYKSHN
jgi:hypothetical protein